MKIGEGKVKVVTVLN